jgi:thiol-disulfide isomerase/thioredoxin
LKNRLLLICLCAGAIALAREFRPTVRFLNADNTLQVKRLDGSGAVVTEEFHPRRTPYVAVYHGASWCGPCQAFSPRLSEFYRDADKTKDRFQLFMVNYDRSDEDMVAYMRQHRMEFPAISRGEAGAWGASTGRGIPNLIIIDTSTGKVVSSSFDGSTYVGCDVPLKALRTIIAQGHP